MKKIKSSGNHRSLTGPTVVLSPSHWEEAWHLILKPEEKPPWLKGECRYAYLGQGGQRVIIHSPSNGPREIYEEDGNLLATIIE